MITIKVTGALVCLICSIAVAAAAGIQATETVVGDENILIPAGIVAALLAATVAVVLKIGRWSASIEMRLKELEKENNNG